MVRKNQQYEGQMSFDDIDRPYHDYSQEIGEYPIVIANDDPVVRQPVNEIVDDSDVVYTPGDLVDATWKNLYDKFGIKPAGSEAIKAAKELFQKSKQSGGSVVAEHDTQPSSDDVSEEMSANRMNVLLALDVYLQYIAYTNKLKGLRSQFHADPSKMKDEYGLEAKDVLHGAQVTRDFMHLEYRDALQILFDARKIAPELADFSTAEDIDSFTKMLEETFGGSGREFSKKRNNIRDNVSKRLGGNAAIAAMALDPPARL